VEADSPDAKWHISKPPELLRDPHHIEGIEAGQWKESITDIINAQVTQGSNSRVIERMTWGYPNVCCHTFALEDLKRVS